MYTGLGVAVCDEEKRGLESHLFFFLAYLSSWGPYNLAEVRCRV